MMRRALLYVAGVMCLAVAVLQAVTFVGGYSWGFTHEVWQKTPVEARHANTGAIMDQGRVFLFLEREQHPVPAGAWKDSSEWQAVSAPPQFEVSSYRQEHRWIVLNTGYRLITRQPGARYAGQYHLIVVSPLVLLPVCVFCMFFVMRTAVRRTHVDAKHCVKCGYDLRGGHERCPECGTPVSAELVQK